jgi:hypothetical protein
MPKPMDRALLGAQAQEHANAAATWAERTANLAKALREQVNPSYISAGPPRGSNKQGAELSKSVKELRSALKRWSAAAKALKVSR